MATALDFLHQSGFEDFDRDPNALDLPAGELDADALQIGAEGPARALGHVSADAAGFFGHAAAVDDAALGGAFAGNGTDAGHDGKWLRVEEMSGMGEQIGFRTAWQGKKGWN